MKFVTMNIYQIVGNNIRGFRNKKGWTQEKLAVRAELSINYMGYIERAEKKVTLETMVKIARTLRIHPNLLLIENAYNLSD
jgi:transcriptional regulator with XRE-family HTH domain